MSLLRRGRIIRRSEWKADRHYCEPPAIKNLFGEHYWLDDRYECPCGATYQVGFLEGTTQLQWRRMWGPNTPPLAKDVK